MTTVTDNTRKAVADPLMFALLLALAIGGLMIFAGARWHFDINAPDFFPLNLLLPLGAGGIVFQGVKAARAALRLRRQGSASVELASPLPSGLGQWLAGRVRLARPLVSPRAVRCELRCLERYPDSFSTGDRRKFHTHVAWREAQDLPPPDDPRLLPFRIRLPATLKRLAGFIEPSRGDGVRRESLTVLYDPVGGKQVIPGADTLPFARVWVLRVEAKQPGGDFVTEFDLPIEVRVPGDAAH